MYIHTFLFSDRSMSGLEVIGAIAGISQLTQYTTSLILNLQALYHNVKHSGERCDLYREQIKQLLQVADLINSLQEVLKSEAIITHVRALVRTTETIEKVLKQGCVGDDARKWKKCLKAWKWSREEDVILQGFSDLERDKNCLTLCILATYGGLISRIDSNIEDGIPQIQSQVGKIERILSSCSTVLKEGDRIKDDSTFLSKHTCPHQASLNMNKANEVDKELVIRAAQALQAKSRTQGRGEAFQATSVNESVPDIQSRRDSGYGTPADTTLADEAPSSAREWSGNVAFDGAMQINGNVGKKDAIDAALVHCHWKQNEARGQSKQVNGEILDAKFAAIFFCQTQTTGV